MSNKVPAQPRRRPLRARSSNGFAVLVLAAVFQLSGRDATAQDECSTASEAVVGSSPFTNVGATRSIDPVNISMCPQSPLGWTTAVKDIWFRYTPPTDGLLSVDTCQTGSFDTSLVLYRGECSALVQIACNGDAAWSAGCQNFHSAIVDLPVEGGVPIQIRIGGYGGATGTGTLTLGFLPIRPACGAGESCSTVHATPGCSDAFCCASVCRSDPWCCEGSWDQLCVGIAAGQCGFLDYSCDEPNPAVPNDCAADATVLEADAELAFSLIGCNTDGPTHSSTACSSGNTLLLNDIWYRFRANSDGPARIDTCGTADFDTKLAVYDLGQDPAAFDLATLPAALVGCNDDGGAACQAGAAFASELDLNVEQGRWYLVRVATYDNPGSGTVRIDMPDPCDPVAAELAEGESCGVESNSGCGGADMLDAVPIGATIEGAVSRNGASIDTDRYLLDIGAPARVTVAVASRAVIDARLEVGDPTTCDFRTVVGLAGGCSATLEQCLSPGRYYIAVAASAQGADPVDCTDPLASRYTVSVTASPADCPQTARVACTQPAGDSYSLNADTVSTNGSVWPVCLGTFYNICARGGSADVVYARPHPAGSLAGSVRCVKFGVSAERQVAVAPGSTVCTLIPSDVPLPATLRICRDIDGGPPRNLIASPGDGGDLETIALREIQIPGGRYIASVDFDPPICLSNETNPIVVVLEVPKLGFAPATSPLADRGYRLFGLGNTSGPGSITYTRSSCVNHPTLRSAEQFGSPVQWLVEVAGDFAGCGCEFDSDGDLVPDCADACPNDPAKLSPGTCGCGIADIDTDSDGVPDCLDGCPGDPAKTTPGACGCGIADIDTDSDGVPDCLDGCPGDPAKTAPGTCGCSIADSAVDSDGDGTVDCIDNCPSVANAAQEDCDASGVGDACEIVSGALGDCDGDGVPDNCEGATRVRLDSGLLAPFGSGAPATFTFTGLAPASGPAPRLVIEASSDLGSANEFIALTLDGGGPAYAFVEDGSDCPPTPDVLVRTFTLAEFAQFAADGSLRVDLLASATVSASQCQGGGVRIRLEYDRYSSETADCDGDGLLDSCEVALGSGPDLNGNGRLDGCDIAAGLDSDCDANGVPDAVDLIGGSAADCDGDGILDACAIAAGEPDCDGDGVPDACEPVRSVLGFGAEGFTASVQSAPFTRIACGSAHTLALSADGKLTTWGFTGFDEEPPPADIGGIVAAAAGNFHSAVIDGSGRVRCFGNNEWGQCDAPVALPRAVAVAASKSSYEESSFLAHTIALLDDGSVRCWGSNNDGQCVVPPGVVGATAIAAGGRHSLARLASGVVAAWGSNGSSQCEVPAGLGAVSWIAAGHQHSLAIRADGTVACWGGNRNGQCAVPAGLAGVAQVAGGGRHSLALRDDGTVVAWGAVGTTAGQANVPTGLADVVAIDAAESQSAALRADGTVVRWGSDYMTLPRPPVFSQPIRRLAVSGAAFNTYRAHAVAVLADGSVTAWGVNGAGQCDVPPTVTDAIDVAAASASTVSGGHSVALLRNGQVVCWGNNTSGQCAVPSGLGPVRAIAAGLFPAASSSVAYGYTVALEMSGRVRVWGANNGGQRDVPTTLTDARAVAAGPAYALAVRAGGTVVAWGSSAGAGGALVPPASLGGVRRVAAGSLHALALRDDGTVVAWGSVSSVPADLADVRAIAAGYQTSFALRADGSIVHWGGPFGTSVVSHGPFAGVSAQSANCALLRREGTDCDGNGVLDSCDIAGGGAVDCDGNGRIDSCEIVADRGRDCDADGVLDACEFASGAAVDCDGNGRLDSCDAALGGIYDCDGNGLVDACEISSGAGRDCDADGRIDSCEVAAEAALDCNGNGLVDSCEIASGAAADCDSNGRIDSCDASGAAVVAWGSSPFGALAVPPSVGDPVAVEAGGDHALVLGSDGRVRAWGSNALGQAAVPSDLAGVLRIAAGSVHSVALRADGTLSCWGSNAAGQCDVPADLGPVASIAAGGAFTMTRDAAGSVRCFGSNGAGQCDVPADLGVASAIGAGGSHALAVRVDGSVRAWGLDARGQCLVPYGISNATKVDGGSWHSVALLGDGRVVCWGAGHSVGGSYDHGQSDVPDGLGPCVDIDAGRRETVALRADGLVVRWGRGDGAFAVPAGLGAMRFIAAGSDFVVAGRPRTADCNLNGVPDSCESLTADCDGDGIPDACEIAAGAPDCDGSGVPDSCQLASGSSTDLDGNGVLDECPGELIVGGSGFANLQQAVDAAADGATIRVAPGTHVTAATVAGKRVHIRPLQAGVETVLSGEGTGTAIVAFDGAAASGSSISGFTLRDGAVGRDFAGFRVGGAIAILYATVVIEDCVFLSNSAEYGGAVYAIGSASRLTRCRFEQNAAIVDGGALEFGLGGGWALDDCEFRANQAAMGGAIHLWSTGGAMNRCSILDCVASGQGGGVSWYSIGSTAVLLAQCTVEGNSAAVGGGLARVAGDGAFSVGLSRFCRNLPQNAVGAIDDLGGNVFSQDCDLDGVCDADEIAAAAEADCDADGIPDDCEIADGSESDCNANSVLDACDIAGGFSNDVDANGVPDECKPDCDSDGLPDAWEIAQGLDADCNANAVLDRCEIAGAPGLDCDLDGALDSCQLAADPGLDCDANLVLDSCDIASGAEDKNLNGVPDGCELDRGDFDLDGVVGPGDLAFLLSFWGFPSPPVGDLDGSGTVGGGDLAILLTRWGPLDW